MQTKKRATRVNRYKIFNGRDLRMQILKSGFFSVRAFSDELGANQSTFRSKLYGVCLVDQKFITELKSRGLKPQYQITKRG